MALTATEAAARLGHRPGFVWLDGDGTTAGRYSVLSCDPSRVISAPFTMASPLDLLDALDTRPRETTPRWMGYIAYDAAWCAAYRRGQPRLERSALPVMWFGRYDAMLRIDHAAGRAEVIGEPPAARRLEALLDTVPEPTGEARVTSIEATDPTAHLHAIARALHHIGEGDVYQVNLARMWHAAFDGDPLRLWTEMRDVSPVPLGFYLDATSHQVLARTMETFLHWNRSDRRLCTRPIKGTIARRGQDADEVERLRGDAKERAEHSMIVDLMRNDLSRVAETGSVRVDAALDVEAFRGLHHMVSTISCRTRPSVGAADLLRATFPPGSVTGAPKTRAVQLIEQLESHARGVYTGCVGYLDGRELSLAVAIRTATIHAGVARYYAGGGIVEASDPERELAETELKARAFLDAAAALAPRS